ncbi:MAG: hypothetical protein ABW213_11235 [Tardiphaga sp.]
MIRHLIVPLALTALTLSVGQAAAQGAFPAPLPGQIQTNDPAFPPVNGAPRAAVGAPPASPFPSAGAPAFGGGGAGFQQPMSAPAQGAGPADACMKNFIPLREEAEKRGKMIKAASDRHAPPEEACKLISNFGEAEVKMIKYIQAHAASCGIPAQIADQLKNGHKGTEALRAKVCNVAQQMQQQQRSAAPTLSDVLGSAAALPEANAAKKGGSAFDTLTGNVLTR